MLMLAKKFYSELLNSDGSRGNQAGGKEPRDEEFKEVEERIKVSFEPESPKTPSINTLLSG